jgi:hypothetical protein
MVEQPRRAELMVGSSRNHRRKWAFASALLVSTGLAVGFASAEDLKPKFGPDAITIQQSHGYFRDHEAPHYWALSPYYVPQFTDSACSVAAIAMLLNALRGAPPNSVDPLVTQQALLDKVASAQWSKETAQDGAGVTWDEFLADVRAGLAAYGLAADIEIMKPRDDSAATLAQVRRLLAANESSDRDIVLAYFNQGVLTGDWDGPHISPIASYDADLGRVLVMDVDRQWYIPYWSSDEKLLSAMLRPAPANMGVLAGQTGGLVRVRLETGK